MAATTKKKNCWNWTTRSLFATISIICIVFCSIGYRFRNAQRQAASVALVTAAGGKVVYTHEMKDDIFQPNAPIPAPEWAQRLFGAQFFVEVSEVTLRVDECPNAVQSQALAAIADLPYLRALTIRQFSNGAEGNDSELNSIIAGLVGRTQLTSLELRFVNLDHKLVSSLADARGLKQLWIIETNVVNEWLQTLLTLPNLRDLRIMNSARPDKLESLIGLTCDDNTPNNRLEVLYIEGVPLSDDALLRIAEITSLRELSLGSTFVSDNGLRHLDALSRLESLDLFDTDISTECVAILNSFDTLKWLGVRRTALTADSIHKLESALPNCHIVSDFSK